MKASDLPDYILADPTGNITALVTSPVSEISQATVAGLLFRAEPSVEQVGFLSRIIPGRSAALRMSGGEFCGNASLSAAAYVLMRSGESRGTVTLDFSGLSAPVTVSVEKQSEGVFTGEVDMPLPDSVSEELLPCGVDSFTLPVIRFPGIAHVLFSGNLSRSEAETAVRSWCSMLDVPALGLMLLSPDGRRLTPLVFVRDVNSLYWETSCASGTCAAAWFRCRRDGCTDTSFAEPGGTLSAHAEEGCLKLLGSVRFPEFLP